jgi:long-chain acyl-CoA synthetase
MTLSLATVLAEPAWRQPDKTAVIQGAERLSYAELWAEARGQAAAIRELGVQPGDRVALMSPNVFDFPRSYYAILAAGAVVVPVHMLLTPEEIAFILRDSGAKLLIAHAIRAEDAVKAAALADVQVRLVGPIPAEAPLPKLADDVAKVEPLTTYVSRQPEDPAVVIYTSGTTGKPKGAILTNLNMVMNATVNGFDCLNTVQDDVALGCLPLFHIFGQTVSMNTIFRTGATVVFQPRFEADEAIDLMLEHGVNTFHGVPQMYLALVQAGKARREAGQPLPKLKIAISGGAALPRDRARGLQRDLRRGDHGGLRPVRDLADRHRQPAPDRRQGRHRRATRSGASRSRWPRPRSRSGSSSSRAASSARSSCAATTSSPAT